MIRTAPSSLALASLLAATLMLSACDAGQSTREDTVSSPMDEQTPSPRGSSGQTDGGMAERSAGAPGAATPPPGHGSGVDEGYPDLTPAPLAPEAERGEKGARNVLLSFIRAIELKEFAQAYGLMRAGAREGLNQAQFAAMFDGFGTTTVAAPDGTIEGAAGTLYYTAPVTITGSNGQELTGEIVLSRVNDVPGASEEQLRWRVRSFDLSER